MAMFRTLTAREIECRVQSVKQTGLILLLYKDARCDQAILDETVGPMNWQRGHCRDNKNCIVSIWDEQKQQWISKEDTGTESNTEAEKGLASDSFKRACVNWGIGRELYTAPFIWIPNDYYEMDSGGKNVKTRFEVSSIAYNEHREISGLVIVNQKTKAVVYAFGGLDAAGAPQEQGGDEIPSASKSPVCEVCGAPIGPWVSGGEVKVTAEEFAENTRKSYGKALCKRCAKAAKNENKGG